MTMHSRVRARTKPEAERVRKYMARPVLALNRLLFLELTHAGGWDILIL